jgi:ribonuclease HII
VTPLAGVRDSKTLSARQRAVLVPRLFGQAVSLAVASASVREIDRFNIRVATAIAMRRAIDRVLRRMGAAAHIACCWTACRCGMRPSHEALVGGSPVLLIACRHRREGGP